MTGHFVLAAESLSADVADVVLEMLCLDVSISSRVARKLLIAKVAGKVLFVFPHVICVKVFPQSVHRVEAVLECASADGAPILSIDLFEFGMSDKPAIARGLVLLAIFLAQLLSTLETQIMISGFPIFALLLQLMISHVIVEIAFGEELLVALFALV